MQYTCGCSYSLRILELQISFIMLSVAFVIFVQLLVTDGVNTSTTVAGTLVSDVGFTFRDCTVDTYAAVRFSDVHVTPDPVTVPGNITISYDISILSQIDNDHFELRVTTSKKVLLGDVTLLCLHDPSKYTCIYPACEIMDLRKIIPLLNTTEVPRLPTTCPLPIGKFSYHPATFEFANLTSFFKYLAEGQFKVHVELSDKRTGEIVSCFNVQISFYKPCSGPLCVFG